MVRHNHSTPNSHSISAELHAIVLLVYFVFSEGVADYVKENTKGICALGACKTVKTQK